MGSIIRWAGYIAVSLMVLTGSADFAHAQDNPSGHDELIARIDSLNELTFQYLTTNPAEAEPVMLNNLSQADSIGYMEGVARAASRLSLIYSYLQKPDKDVEHALLSIKTYEDLGMYVEAGYEYAELGYGMRRRDRDEGERYMRKGLKLLENVPGSINQANAFNNYSVIKLEKGQIDSARYYVERSLEIKREYDDTLGIAYSLGNLGNIEIEEEDFQKAISYLTEAYQLREQIQDTSGMAIDLVNIGLSYQGMNQLSEAIIWFKRSFDMAEQIDYGNLAQYCLMSIANAYKNLRKFDQAYDYQSRYMSYRDSLQKQQSKARIEELEIQFKTEQQAKELASRNAELAGQKLRNRQQFWWLSGLAGIVVSGLFIGGLIVRQQRIRRGNLERENELQAQLAQVEMENMLHEERERISRDLHDNVGAQITNLITGLEMGTIQVKRNQTDEATLLLTQLDADARKAMADLRETIWMLDQEDIPFVSFYDHVADYLRKQQRYLGGMETSLKERVGEQIHLNPAQSLNMMRIIQEALNNARKHAEATRFTITFTSEQQILNLTITDNGCGFSSSPSDDNGHGLVNMKNRARSIGAVYNLTSTPNEGTTVKVKLKLSSAS